MPSNDEDSTSRIERDPNSGYTLGKLRERIQTVAQDVEILFSKYGDHSKVLAAHKIDLANIELLLAGYKGQGGIVQAIKDMMKKIHIAIGIVIGLNVALPIVMTLIMESLRD